jgi:signal transduction histidine kinase
MTATSTATTAAPTPGTGASAPLKAASAPGSRHRGITVQGWIQLVLGAMVLLVLVFAGISAQLLSRNTDLSDELSNRVQPARVEGVRLQAALLDQETGVRGYVITHSTEFLAPYTDGLAQEKTISARLHPLIRGNQSATADLKALQDAAAEWRTQYAEPLIAHARQDQPADSDATLLAGSKTAFDRIRALYAAEDKHLLADRVHSQADLNHVQSQRNFVFVAMLATFLVAAAVLTLLVRQIVGRPLRRLRDDALRVASGDFEGRIGSSGPADLRVVAETVEAMRSRLAGALTAAHDQRALLAEQTAELADQAEELRRSNSELEQFAYVASHDLQEPLRKVASFCQLLERRYRDKLDERGMQYIDFAVDGAKRMQILITDLLAFSRVGRTQEDPVPVSLDGTLDQALRNLGGLIEDSEVEIRRPSPLPETLGDPTLLTAVWQNLVANAVKFRSPERPPVVTVESSVIGGEYSLTVTDNGIGIAEEFSEKVFVIFQRLHSRDVYEGTGIGLAMCRKIVEHHGGRISVDNAYTGGTRIRFTLPIPEQEPEPAAVEEPAGEPEGEPAGEPAAVTGPVGEGVQ